MPAARLEVDQRHRDGTLKLNFQAYRDCIWLVFHRLASVSGTWTVYQRGGDSLKRSEKKELVTVLHSSLKESQGAFLLEYQGLNVESMNKLRTQLRNAGAEFMVVKNRLLKLASRDTAAAVMQVHMTGPNAIATTQQDVVGSAKALIDFAKDSKFLKIKVGQVSGKLVQQEDIRKLAELPGREVLLAQALSAMQAVPASLVRVLNGVLLKLLYVLKAIENEKAESKV